MTWSSVRAFAPGRGLGHLLPGAQHQGLHQHPAERLLHRAVEVPVLQINPPLGRDMEDLVVRIAEIDLGPGTGQFPNLVFGPSDSNSSWYSKMRKPCFLFPSWNMIPIDFDNKEIALQSWLRRLVFQGKSASPEKCESIGNRSALGRYSWLAEDSSLVVLNFLVTSVFVDCIKYINPYKSCFCHLLQCPSIFGNLHLSRAGHMTLQRLPQPATLGLPADSIGSRLAAEKNAAGSGCTTGRFQTLPLDTFGWFLGMILQLWGWVSETRRAPRRAYHQGDMKPFI